MTKLASTVCPTSLFGAWSLCLPVSPATKSACQNWQACTEEPTFACRQSKYLLADMQNMLDEHEIFEKFGGGKTSKQGQVVESI